MLIFALIWQIKAILTFGLCSTFVLCYECHCVPVTLWWKIAGPVANWVILISHSHLVWISAILNLIFCVFLILNSIRLRSLCFWEIVNFLIFKTLILLAVGFFDNDDWFILYSTAAINCWLRHWLDSYFCWSHLCISARFALFFQLIIDSSFLISCYHLCRFW